MSDNSFAGINFDDPNSKNIFETHAEMMCPEFKNTTNGFLDNVRITKNGKHFLTVSGTIDNSNQGNYFIKYIAAHPPTYSSNFSGSGMPFPTEEIAYDNTPNQGVVNIINGKFSFSIKYPNSYYINMGTIYINPHVKIVLVDKNNNELSNIKVINLGEGIPFRTLSWPKQRNWNEGPLFYKTDNLPVRNQYQILLDSAYPSENVIPKNFWGLMPPH